MAIKEITRPYELLVRFKEDGKIAGHVADVAEIVKDGKVIHYTAQDPRPIELAGPAFASVMALLDQALIRRNADLMADVVAKAGDLQAAAASNEALAARVRELEANLVMAGQTISTKAAEAEGANARVVEIEGKLAEANSLIADRNARIDELGRELLEATKGAPAEAAENDRAAE